MKIASYDIGREIGSGSFGTVNLAEHRATGEVVAVKCISKNRIQRNNMGTQVKKEITTMKKLSHPNIVRIHEVLMSNSHLYLVMEYAGGGELFSKIARQGKLSESVAKRYFYQIMDAVRFCHNLCICHRDIKPENILLDANDNVKIADFGFASIMEPELTSETPGEVAVGAMSTIDEQGTVAVKDYDGYVPRSRLNQDQRQNKKFQHLPSKKMRKMSTVCGTMHYMAPEIVSRDSYRGDKADMWSCGIVLFVLVTGFLPFDSTSPEAVTAKITSGVFQIPSFLSSPARDIIQNLLTPNPLVRPGAATVLEHERFRDLPPPRTKADQHCDASKTPPLAALKSKEVVKVVGREKRTATVPCGREAATSKVCALFKAHAWTLKSGGEPHRIKASKMTSTGLAMLQVDIGAGGAKVDGKQETTVEIVVFNEQSNAGANEINNFIAGVREL